MSLKQVLQQKNKKSIFAEYAKKQDEFGCFLSRERFKTVPYNKIPIAIKDNILVRDLPCTAGSKILENYIAPLKQKRF